MSTLPKPPKDALKKLSLGQSFAENDVLLRKPDVFVETPAALAARDTARGRCLFVGRRGTGKTAITIRLESIQKNTVIVSPHQFVPSDLRLPLEAFGDTRQRPFKSLCTAFKHTMVCEVILRWIQSHLITFSRLPDALTSYRNQIEQQTFDSRLLSAFDEFLTPLANSQDREWLKAIRRYDTLRQAINNSPNERKWRTTLLIDRLDDAWSGDDASVLVLMALMHACVQIRAECDVATPLLFVRENVFDRVRHIDNEFARLETSVVSLDWTPDQLLELVERRLNASFTTRWPLRGSTWPLFFEDGADGASHRAVFEYCQHRPRDVITYLSFAVDAAVSAGRPRVSLVDLQHAKRRFSENRFKDLCDEYSENCPQLRLVLDRFFGLAQEYTIGALEDFIQLLVVNPEVQRHCGSWLNERLTVERFVEWLYSLGFAGLRRGQDVGYKVLSARSATSVPLDHETQIVVHPTFRDALQLQDKVATSLQNVELRSSGILEELPAGLNLDSFVQECKDVQAELKTLPQGKGHAKQFEEVVGKILRLCFYRVLSNPEPKSRTNAGEIIRDWVASVTATHGFWDIIRTKYGAVQVVWECKNYDALKADDFHQVNYYHSEIGGKFSVIAFRGERQDSYVEHQKRIAIAGGFSLLLTERDLNVFLRQAQKGKWQDTHIQTCYDEQLRKVS